MRALIVDDSAVMRKVVERALRQAGLDFSEVLQASNGAEALDVLRQPANQGLSLIVTDINMPTMDGIEFLERRRAEAIALETPVVIITTEGAESLVLRAITAGARGYVCKPFTAEEVRAHVVPLLAATGPHA